MPFRELHPTRCAICGVEGYAVELYPANFSIKSFNAAVFSARRLPDRIHYRIVRCNTCGLVRSDPVTDPQILAKLYKQSAFNYNDEVDNLKLTYGRYLSNLKKYGAEKGALLEIGCGNGFFLEEALKRGYSSVRGVEPSHDAVARAGPSVRPHIVCDIMRPNLFGQEQFDVLCMFQVLDHISDPSSLLDECFRVLKPGGLFLCLNHNVKSLSALFFGERSPVVDIEHTYLYGPDTMSRLFALHGFDVLKISSVMNIYSPYYVARLVPLPHMIKEALLKFLKIKFFRFIRLLVPLGNICLVARKPI